MFVTDALVKGSDRPSSATDLRMRYEALVGYKVADRFTIRRFLGEGGMATVYVAEQDAEPRYVALKIMNEDLTADRSFVRRFQREAQAASRVQHPNSVQIVDYGVAGDLSYIAMELLVGDDLYVLLERQGAIGQSRAARILIEVCDALAVAHEMGIVHRDLKPENIMIIADPSHPNGERVKVLDFGIAKLIALDAIAEERGSNFEQNSAVTRAGTFIGTPAYMSPEQCSLLPVDTRADIYTSGVLLFQLVTGRIPFEGQTPLHTATLHIHEAPPRPSSLAPGIDLRLEAVILKAIAKKPDDRYQTARQLGDALRKLLPDLSDLPAATGAVSKRPRSSWGPPSSGAVSSKPKASRPELLAGFTAEPAVTDRPPGSDGKEVGATAAAVRRDASSSDSSARPRLAPSSRKPVDNDDVMDSTRTIIRPSPRDSGPIMADEPTEPFFIPKQALIDPKQPSRELLPMPKSEDSKPTPGGALWADTPRVASMALAATERNDLEDELLRMTPTTRFEQAPTPSTPPLPPPPEKPAHRSPALAAARDAGHAPPPPDPAAAPIARVLRHELPPGGSRFFFAFFTATLFVTVALVAYYFLALRRG
jgi:serine/threonine-protein kinase